MDLWDHKDLADHQDRLGHLDQVDLEVGTVIGDNQDPVEQLEHLEQLDHKDSRGLQVILSYCI